MLTQTLQTIKRVSDALILLASAFLFFIFSAVTAFGVAMAVIASFQGHPLDESTLRIVSNSFVFTLGILTGWGIRSVFERPNADAK